MKSNKITSLKKAREIIERSGILEIDADDGTTDANLITWWDGEYYNALGYLYRDRKSHKIYMMLDTPPSVLRAIGKVFKYEIVCSIYGSRSTDFKDISILWLKEAVNECTSR